jgi:protein-disulfide isomerase
MDQHIYTDAMRHLLQLRTLTMRHRLNTVLSSIVLGLTMILSAPAMADSRTGVIHIHGNEKTPIVIEEFVSLTCSHCAKYTLETLPKLESYVQEGKVRFETHIYVRDEVDLKAANLAYCMPNDKFMPFLKVLFENQAYWPRLTNPDDTLIRYAKLGGLDEAKAKQCINDETTTSNYGKDRDFTDRRYNIQGTPTIIFNNGVETLVGFQDEATMKDVIERILKKNAPAAK